MDAIRVELVVPLSTIALCLIGASTATAIASLTFAVVGLYGEVKRLRERFTLIIDNSDLSLKRR